MQIAIQRRLEQPSYSQSMKNVQDSNIKIPGYLTAMKEKPNKDTVIQCHESRFTKIVPDKRSTEDTFRGSKQKSDKQQEPPRKKKKINRKVSIKY